MDCIPVSGRRGSFVTGEVTFTAGRFVMSSPRDLREAMIDIHSRTQKDDIVPILDVDSFDRRFMNSDFVKEIRLKGRRLWFISNIRSIDDIIDAMCGPFDMLCVPYHTLDNPDVLSEGFEISETLIPTIFVDRGMRPVFDGTMDRTVKDILGRGFHEYALFDTSRCVLHHQCVYSDPDTSSDRTFTVLPSSPSP